MIKGDIERFKYNYGAAVKAYDQVDDLVQKYGANDVLLRERVNLADVDTTLDPAHVVARLAQLSADPIFAKDATRSIRAEIEDLQARAAINLGDKSTAAKLISRAVDDSGGLTTSKVSSVQAAIRADAGIISRLRNDDEGTRKYFTYTGAGHLKDMSWVGKRSGDLPICGGPEDEVRPDDSVVIDFALSDDGRVKSAVPVYASRPGALGMTFARAVSDWRWDPEKIKSVNGFWRATLQLELRCVSRPRPETLGHATWQAVIGWLTQHQLVSRSDLATGNDGDEFTVRSDDPRLNTLGGAVLLAVAIRPPGDMAGLQVLWRRLDEAQAPPSAYAILAKAWSRARARNARDGFKAEARLEAQNLEKLRPKFQQQFPNDPAVNWLLISEALSLEDSGDFVAAQPLLQTLLASLTNPDSAGDPIRRVALLHQAIVLERSGNAAAARDSLERSGLDKAQCSLFDTHPVPTNVSVSSSDFPREAQRWGFEGYVQEAFDIADDGRVKNVRTVVAYPPYIFEDSSESAVKQFRFAPPRLGGNVIGCEGQQETVNFRINP
jgi:hypothetical protein